MYCNPLKTLYWLTLTLVVLYFTLNCKKVCCVPVYIFLKCSENTRVLGKIIESEIQYLYEVSYPLLESKWKVNKFYLLLLLLLLFTYLCIVIFCFYIIIIVMYFYVFIFIVYLYNFCLTYSLLTVKI